jgi:small-conductance mechanosensitive channel
MSEEKDEEPLATEEMDRPFEEREEGLTSVDVTDKEISIGEVPTAVPQEEIPQEEKPQEMEQAQEEPRVSKKKQKRRRTTSYLLDISKQVEKNGNQINKITMMTQSLLKQGQAKSTSGAGVVQSQFQSIKQIRSQISQLQKQVALIQKNIQRIRTAPGTKARTRKRPFAITMPKSKKSKSITSIKARKSRRSR